MKRTLTLLAMGACLLAAHAQRLSLSFDNISLSEALRKIDQAQQSKRINFVYNELEDFRVSKRIVRQDALDAVREVCGFYPVSIVTSGDDIFVECVQKAEHKYTGMVVDNANQPLPFANVALLSPTDSTLIVGGVTNEDGLFVIPCEQRGVLARVTFLGYKTVTVKCKSHRVGNICLHPQTMTLKGVTVKGERLQYRMTDGGMCVDVENSLLSQMGTANDVLNQLPRVAAMNGKVTVFAKGTPLIYINNKKMTDSQELTELKSEDIKNIEVITSPGAQYDATVKSVIRIRTRRPAYEGFSVRNDAQAAYNSTWTGYGQNMLKYRTKKLEIANKFYYISSTYKEDNNLRNDLDTSGSDIRVSQKADNQSRDNVISENITASYTINDSNSIGAMYRYYTTLSDNSTLISRQSIIRDGQYEGSVDQKGTMKRMEGPRQEVDVYYNGKIGHWSIDFDGTYLFRKSYEHNVYDEHSEELGRNEVNSYGEQRNRMYAAKLVLGYPMLGGNLSFGSEYTNTQSLGTYKSAGGYEAQSETDVRETNAAAFFQYAIPLGRYRLSAGMRYEHVVSEYRSFGQKEDGPSRTYDELFPNLALSWSKGKAAWQLTYAMKTSRPSYRMLRDFKQYDNRYVYEGGNPYLRPSKTHNIEATGMYSWLNIVLGYNYDSDHMEWTFSVPEGQEVAYMTNCNFDHSQDVYANISASPKFGWYQPMLELGYTQQFFNARKYGADCSLDKPVFSIRQNNRFACSPTLTATLNWSASTTEYSGFLQRKGCFALSASLRKSFAKDRWVITLRGTDLLKTVKEKWTMYGIHIVANKDCYDFSRQVSLTVTYNFNSTRSKYKGTGAGNAERNRL